MHQLTQVLWAHSGTVLAVMGAIYFAVVTALPEDPKDFHWYTYLRTVAISIMPIARPQSRKVPDVAIQKQA